MDFEKYIVQEEDNVLEVMKKINKNPQGAMFVCKKNQLLGAITDGDIRRHLINNGGLNASIQNVYNRNPVFVHVSEKINYSLFMRNKGIRALPIVDDKMYVINIIVLSELELKEYSKVDIPVVIMAGGKGTRLMPYTNILPKPLIPIGEKTITEHIMENFQKFSCNHFNMIVNYKKNFIKSYFLDNDIKKDVVFTEEECFLGTGGGLSLLKGKYKSTFFMTNCDIIIQDDYFKIYEKHKRKNNIITIVCAKKKVILPYGIIKSDKEGNLLEIEEKPQYDLLTNTGFYVIEPEFLELIPDNTFIHITEIIQQCINKKLNIGIYEVDEKSWLDMGQIEELKKMQNIMNA